MTRAIKAYRFLEENFIDPTLREACYFISDLIKTVPDKNDTVIKVDGNSVTITIIDYSFGVELFIEDSKIEGIEFHQLVFHSYDYFTKNPSKKFFKNTSGDDLVHIKTKLLEHIDRHDNVHMFALLKELA